MKRDFTTGVRDQLKELVEDKYEIDWSVSTAEYVDDLLGTEVREDWTTLENQVSAIRTNNSLSVTKIDEIWNKIAELDTAYAAKLTSLNDLAEAYREKIKFISDKIKPGAIVNTLQGAQKILMEEFTSLNNIISEINFKYLSDKLLNFDKDGILHIDILDVKKLIDKPTDSITDEEYLLLAIIFIHSEVNIQEYILNECFDLNEDRIYSKKEYFTETTAVVYEKNGKLEELYKKTLLYEQAILSLIENVGEDKEIREEVRKKICNTVTWSNLGQAKAILGVLNENIGDVVVVSSKSDLGGPEILTEKAIELTLDEKTGEMRAVYCSAIDGNGNLNINVYRNNMHHITVSKPAIGTEALMAYHGDAITIYAMKMGNPTNENDVLSQSISNLLKNSMTGLLKDLPNPLTNLASMGEDLNQGLEDLGIYRETIDEGNSIIALIDCFNLKYTRIEENGEISFMLSPGIGISEEDGGTTQNAIDNFNYNMTEGKLKDFGNSIGYKKITINDVLNKPEEVSEVLLQLNLKLEDEMGEIALESYF